MAAKTKKAAEKQVEQAYYSMCSGVVINIMDIPKVFKVGLDALANGADDVELQAVIYTFVRSIEKAS